MDSIKDWFIRHCTEIVIAIIAVLSPLTGIMVSVGCLIAFDFISGIAAAHKRGESITSRKMSMTVSKIIFYNLALFTAVGLQFLIVDVLPITKLIAGVIGMVEAKSIYENIGDILGINMWKVIVDYMKRNQDNTKDLINGIEK